MIGREFLHLLHLKGLLKVKGSASDVPADNKALNCVPQANQTFLRFPISETASRLNHAVHGLVLFNHPSFNFQSPNDELRELYKNDILENYFPSHPKKFSSVAISGDSYLGLKEDVQSQQYKKWLTDDEISFFSLWLMKDENAKVVKGCEIVSPIVTGAVQDFFKNDCHIAYPKGYEGRFSTSKFNEVH